MSAVFKLLMNFLPQADIVYVVLFIGLGGALAYEVHHLKSEGAAAQVAADTKLAAEVTAHNADLQTAAATKTAAIEAQYESDLQTIPTPAPHVVCIRVAPPGNSVPKTAGGPSGSGQGAQPGVSGAANGAAGSVDIGTPLTVAGHDADAQIKALQADVQTLLAEMAGAQ